MPILGAGASSAGTSFGGFGTPATATGPGSLVATPGSGGLPPAPLTCSKIDPATKDYVYDSTGNRVQITTAQQCVYLAIQTVKGTSADKDLGLIPPPGAITSTYLTQRAAQYQAALQRITTRNIAQILSVTIVQNTPTQTFEVVKWQDLTTGAEQELYF